MDWFAKGKWVEALHLDPQFPQSLSLAGKAMFGSRVSKIWNHGKVLSLVV